MRDKKKKRLVKRRRARERERAVRESQPEASYTCQNCGEEIVIPFDVSAGSEQEYVEDCPVCCHPHLIHLEQFEDGEIRAWAESEADLNN